MRRSRTGAGTASQPSRPGQRGRRSACRRSARSPRSDWPSQPPVARRQRIVCRQRHRTATRPGQPARRRRHRVSACDYDGGAECRIAGHGDGGRQLMATLAGCAKMDSALSQQWMTVQFSPDTTVATALHVRTACSHVQDTPPLALPAKRSVINVMYGVRFNTTNASPANLPVQDVPTAVQVRAGRRPGDPRRGQLTPRCPRSEADQVPRDKFTNSPRIVGFRPVEPELTDRKRWTMKRVLAGLTAAGLALLAAGCGSSSASIATARPARSCYGSASWRTSPTPARWSGSRRAFSPRTSAGT